jgi:hypothetical protein
MLRGLVHAKQNAVRRRRRSKFEDCIALLFYTSKVRHFSPRQLKRYLVGKRFINNGNFQTLSCLADA